MTSSRPYIAAACAALVVACGPATAPVTADPTGDAGAPLVAAPVARYALSPVDDGWAIAGDDASVRLVVEGSAILVEHDGERHLLLAPARFERGGADVGAGEPTTATVRGPELSFSRPRLDDWYLPQAGGLEQGWTLASPPGAGTDRLSVAMRLGEGVEVLAASDTALALRVDGVDVTYSGLGARDALRRPVGAQMSLRDRDVLLTIDDRGASYPVTIDPLVTWGGSFLATSAPIRPKTGASVAVDGVRALVGEPDAPSTTTREGGLVRVYNHTGGAWSQARTIRMTGTSTTARFGEAVDVHRRWALIGAPGEDAVYAVNLDGIFDGDLPTDNIPMSPPFNWFTRIPKPSPSDTSFGALISISGSRIAVAAASGKVFLYDRGLGGSWSTTPIVIPLPSGAVATSVDLDRSDNGVLLVGASTSMTTGRVFVYRASEGWATPYTFSTSGYTQFGISAQIDGSHLALAAMTSDNHAVVFTSSWEQLYLLGHPTGHYYWTPLLTSLTSSGFAVSTIIPGNLDRQPHVTIARDPNPTQPDLILLGLPNAGFYGTLDALPSNLQTSYFDLCQTCGVRGRAVATDGNSTMESMTSAGSGYVHESLIQRSFSLLDGPEVARTYGVAPDAATPGLHSKVHYKSDGLDVWGFVDRPNDSRFPGARPVMLFLHGGVDDPSVGFDADLDDTSGAYVDAASYYVGKGYVVIAPNYRGNSATTWEGCLGEATDALRMLDLALQQPWGDLSQVYVYGFSRGGCVAERTIERGGRFRAAVVAEGIRIYGGPFTNVPDDPTDAAKRSLERNPNSNWADMVAANVTGRPGQSPVRILWSHDAHDTLGGFENAFTTCNMVGHVQSALGTAVVPKWFTVPQDDSLVSPPAFGDFMSPPDSPPPCHDLASWSTTALPTSWNGPRYFIAPNRTPHEDLQHAHYEWFYRP